MSQIRSGLAPQQGMGQGMGMPAALLMQLAGMQAAAAAAGMPGMPGGGALHGAVGVPPALLAAAAAANPVQQVCVLSGMC